MRLLLGVVLGLALSGTAGLAFLRIVGPCGGRCAGTTRCLDAHCVAAAEPSLPAAPAASANDRRRRTRRATDAATAPAEARLRPGDEKMVAQGDALGRPEHVDFAEGGEDGRELAQEAIDRLVRSVEPAVTKCITDAVGDAPLESGKVEVGLRIERTGQVSRVRVEAPALLQKQGLTRCVRDVMARLHWPPSGGATVVTYPYQLR